MSYTYAIFHHLFFYNVIKYFIGVPSISVSIFTRSDKQKMFISSLVAEPRGVLGASAPPTIFNHKSRGGREKWGRRRRKERGKEEEEENESF